MSYSAALIYENIIPQIYSSSPHSLNAFEIEYGIQENEHKL